MRREHVHYGGMAIDSTWAKGSGGRSAIIFSVVLMVVGAAFAILASDTLLRVFAGLLPALAAGMILISILRARRADSASSKP